VGKCPGEAFALFDAPVELSLSFVVLTTWGVLE
jgi:hypothetical protein